MNPSPARASLERRRFAGQSLAAILGCSIALYMLNVAGVDPWLWWSDYRERTRLPPIVEVRTPPAAGVVLPEPVGTDSSVSKVSRRLILSSTRRGRNARDGTATIGINAGSPQTYRAGALLANGARITEIHEASIILERDGQTVQLFVEGNEPAGSTGIDSPLLTVGGQNVALAAAPDSRDELTDVMRVTPVFEGDAVRALEVHASERSDLFGRLGLQAGDQITSVNGEPVTDASSSIAALRRLTQGEALLLTIVRQGQTETLSLDGAVVVASARESPN
ncbi:MAG: PDZ domain-containing protein [Steroidobacteraceae bacterium]